VGITHPRGFIPTLLLRRSAPPRPIGRAGTAPVCAAVQSRSDCRAYPSDMRIPLGTHLGDWTMLETTAVVLLILWALGLTSSYTMGGFIHVLVVLAIIVILIRVIQGRRI
jgi:hypothetical protein